MLMFYIDSQAIEIILWVLGSLVALDLIIMLILFIMLLPGRKHKNLMKFDWLFEKPIAHRGYHQGNKEVPENSRISFIKAIEKGYNIEIDLNVTKDDKVVVFHDGEATRMCGVDRNLVDMTLEEIKQLRLQGGEEQVMELQEFLDLVNDQVGLLIEFKGSYNGKLERAAYPILKQYNGRYVMQAFQPESLRWFKKNAPEVPRGQLCFNYMPNKKIPWLRRFLFTNLFSNFIGRPHFISYNYPGRKFYTVRVLRSMGAKLLVWTIRNEQDYNAVKDECDNVIFENLDL